MKQQNSAYMKKLTLIFALLLCSSGAYSQKPPTRWLYESRFYAGVSNLVYVQNPYRRSNGGYFAPAGSVGGALYFFPAHGIGLGCGIGYTHSRGTFQREAMVGTASTTSVETEAGLRIANKQSKRCFPIAGAGITGTMNVTFREQVIHGGGFSTMPKEWKRFTLGRYAEVGIAFRTSKGSLFMFSLREERQFQGSPFQFNRLLIGVSWGID
jgi:hypothetical protein